MRGGKAALGWDRWPKLEIIYRRVTGKALVDTHNARADAAACAEVYVALLPKKQMN